ncbi:hypothetical protein CVCC1112_1075 [Paenarthrobacter nicotinovorans]|nr:hypothetical protein CVCC1112_1075 [Paenarthrobacter nicotinovorans]
MACRFDSMECPSAFAAAPPVLAACPFQTTQTLAVPDIVLPEFMCQLEFIRTAGGPQSD